jgi:hypothetical protein
MNVWVPKGSNMEVGRDHAALLLLARGGRDSV